MTTEINLSRLISDIDNPVVYDAVPEPERKSYKYWRGLSLARLALELAGGSRSFLLDGNPVHFADFHLYASNVARGISSAGTLTQISDSNNADRIEQLVGREFKQNTPHPALVVAHANDKPYLLPSNQGMKSGFRIYGNLSDLDPYSQAFIEDYFSIKLPK